MPEPGLPATVGDLELFPHHSHALLFGSGFGGAFAYAKQVAAFAAEVTYPGEALPSANLTALPASHGTSETPHSVVQKRKHIRPMCQMVFRQGFKGP